MTKKQPLQYKIITQDLCTWLNRYIFRPASWAEGGKCYQLIKRFFFTLALPKALQKVASFTRTYGGWANKKNSKADHRLRSCSAPHLLMYSYTSYLLKWGCLRVDGTISHLHVTRAKKLKLLKEKMIMNCQINPGISRSVLQKANKQPTNFITIKS